MLTIDMRADLTGLQRALFTFRADQVPFAAALALTALARDVAEGESDEVRETFENPTPFTQKGFRVEPATKRNLVAWVKAKDAQAQYLAPYVVGGQRWLGSKKAMLVPKALGTNKYGNLPRGKLQQLKGQKDVFIGTVRFKKTGDVVSGVFRRNATARGARNKGGGEYGTKGKNTKVIAGQQTTLSLLIRFEDTTESSKHFPFFERARSVVQRNAKARFAEALGKAIATARK